MVLREKLMLALAGVALLFSACAAPSLQVDDPVWNAGVVVTGARLEKRVILENVGNAPLTIEKIEECCGFFGEYAGKTLLLPGERGELKLSFYPFKMIGDFRAEMFVHSNDPKQPRTSIFAIGQVVAKKYALAELGETVIDLGVVDRREEIPLNLTVRNRGNVPLEIGKVEKSERVVELAQRPPIPAGGEGLVPLLFQPTAAGPIEERISLSSNDGLNRAMVVQLKGYVVDSHTLPARAVSIYPVGGAIRYDAATRSYRWSFNVANKGEGPIEVVRGVTSIPGGVVSVPARVEAGGVVEGELVVPMAEAKSGGGTFFLELALPVALQ